MKSAIDKILDYFNTYYDRYRYEFYLVLLSILAFIVHLHLASTLNLGNDEAHYFVWSLKPSPGYLDDAPFVGYVIYFFTGLFGKSELNVRLGAVIFSFFDGFLIYYLSYLLFKNKRASFFAFLFFLSTVIFSTALSVMMLPDASLLFFYLCFLILFYKAVKGSSNNVKKRSDFKSDLFFRNNLILWMLTGLFLGFAFLSKYTAALIPPSVLLYLLVSKKNRAVLKTFYPYLALAAALLVFSPVIYWNLIHNFISFRFQLSHGFSRPKPGISLFMQGWLGQFLVVTPFIYLFLIGTFVYSTKFILFKKRRHDLNIKGSDFKSDPFIDNLKAESYADIAEGFLYSVCLSFPILGFFIINGYSHRILVHWPDIGYMSAFPIMGYVADKISIGKNNVKSVNKLKYAPPALAIARAVIPAKAGKFRRNFTRKSKTSESEAVIYKIIVYFTIFSGFFLSFVLYNQIYYNSIPIGKIIRYIDKEK
ncbi:MAG: glycosyltransferase family 39 protein, partial [Deltaproteobacteria bacterium]|nr:glycosyltransferase family 39 protein [Deltaproteobacteria bacterium]